MSQSLDSGPEQVATLSYPAQVLAAVQGLYETCDEPVPPVVLVGSVADYNRAINALVRRIRPDNSWFIAAFVVLCFVFQIMSGLAWYWMTGHGMESIVSGMFMGLIPWFCVFVYIITVVPDFPDAIGRYRVLRSSIGGLGRWRAMRTRVANRAPATIVECLRSAQATLDEQPGQAGLLNTTVRTLAAGRAPRALREGNTRAITSGGGRDNVSDTISSTVLMMGPCTATTRSNNTHLPIQVAMAALSLQPRSTIEGMPAVLVAAHRLWSLVDEVVMLDGAVVVMGQGGMGGNAGASVPNLVGGYDLGALNADQRWQCRRALGWRGRNTRTMLRAVGAWADTRAAATVYVAVGLQRVVDLLELVPRQVDASGQLYSIGRASRRVLYVRVQDRVTDHDSQPLVHWLAVPQHVSTAREGVAWSYGLAARDYKPTVEA